MPIFKINKRQAGILADRYFDVMLGDFKNLFLLIIQAPIIAGLIALVWSNIGSPTSAMYFVLTLSCVWFGCINASREIAKERAIFFREKMINLETPAYIFSKIRILVILNFIQCLFLLIITHYYVHIPGNKLLIFLTLYLCSIAGTTLGLFISSLVNNVDKAVGLVPLFIIPQILFSEFSLPKELLSGVTTYIEKLMIAKWCYEAIQHITAPEPNYLIILRNDVILILFGLILFFLSVIVLEMKEVDL